MNDYTKTLCKVQVTLAIKIDSVDWQAHNKGLEEDSVWSWTHRYHTGHQALNHVHPPGWVRGYTFFSLKRQPCVFDIPRSSSGCLWAQGPTCLPQLLCFLIERLAFHVFYQFEKTLLIPDLLDSLLPIRLGLRNAPWSTQESRLYWWLFYS